MDLLSYLQWLASGNARKRGPIVYSGAYPKPDPLNLPEGAVFDDFDGPAGASPKPELWTPLSNKTYNASVMDPECAKLDGNGNLELNARKVDGTWHAALVELVPRLGYGFYYASIKMPKGHGMHSSFWTMGESHDYWDKSSWPKCGENDIHECIADGQYHCTIHGPMYTGTAQSSITGSLGFKPSQAFHRYWCKKEPGLITYGIDATVVGKIGKRSIPKGAPWVLDGPQKVLLSLTVGGPSDWGGAPDETTPESPSMLIDWFYFKPLEG